MLRKMFGPGREEITGGYRKRQNEKRHDLNSSSNTIWGIKVNAFVAGCAVCKNIHGVHNNTKL